MDNIELEPTVASGYLSDLACWEDFDIETQQALLTQINPPGSRYNANVQFGFLALNQGEQNDGVWNN